MNGVIIYGRYARKSSEAEDRQALSIESQTDELARLALKNGILVDAANTFSEAKSAKSAFTRPEFERLIHEIEGGTIQGILAWHANRLSRNAIDAARLVDLMDKGKLREVVTPSQTFKNTPNDKFMFGLMCLQAKMENDSKGVDVKRGLRKKNEMGFPSGVSKPGYKNDYGMKGQRKIIPDSERFNLVKQLFDLFLSGKYSVRKLLRYSDEILGLNTIQRKKEGGKPLKLSRLYDMLKDPFYAGFFFGKDENEMQTRYEVNESIPRVITEEQYWQIQAMLGRKGAPRPILNRRLFAYTGRTRCGTCAGAVTAEHKYQLICSVCKNKFAYQNKTVCPVCETPIGEMGEPTYLHYVYYHCTKSRDASCPERSVQEKSIDASMTEYAENNLEISKALSEWCIKHVDEPLKTEKENEYEQKATWERQKAEKQSEYDELVRMKMKGLIDDDQEFLKIKANLKAEMKRIDMTISSLGGSNLESLERAKDAFRLVVGVSAVFKSGTYDEKHEVLSSLGSNLTLTNKKLSILNKKLFSVFTNGLLEAKAINKAFEPKNCEADKDESGVFAAVRPTLLRMLNDVRTCCQNVKDLSAVEKEFQFRRAA